MARIRFLCPELAPRDSLERGWRWYARGAEAAWAVELYETLRAGRASSDVAETVIDKKRTKTLSVIADGAREVFCKEFRPDAGGVVRETLRLEGEHLGGKGAVVEATRSLLASRRFDHVARLYALGERTRLGAVIEQVLLFEALTGHRGLDQELARAVDDRARQRSALERGLDLLVELDRAGLAHLDANAKNIMLSEGGPEDDRLVDLEQLVEVEPGRPDLLGFVFGYVYQLGVRHAVERADFDDVAVPRLARALGLPRPGELALRSYRYFQKKPLIRRRRLRLARQGIERLPDVHAAVRQRRLGRLAGLLVAADPLPGRE